MLSHGFFTIHAKAPRNLGAFYINTDVYWFLLGVSVHSSLTSPKSIGPDFYDLAINRNRAL
jgi:hypothetical protein